MASNYTHRRSVAIKVSISIIILSITIATISINRQNIQISANYWHQAIDAAEQALILHAHQLCELGWDANSAFKHRIWNAKFDENAKVLNTDVIVTCLSDENKTFMTLNCNAQVNLLDEIYTFEQLLHFTEYSSKQILRFQGGPVSLVKHIDQNGNIFRYDSQTKNNIPSILIELANSEKQPNEWGKSVSKLISAKKDNTFEQYLYFVAVLKTIELIDELTLEESIQMIRSSKLINELVYTNTDYLKLSDNALGIELQTFHSSQEILDFRSFIKKILINLAQTELANLDTLSLKNPLYVELVKICSTLNSENWVNTNFKKIENIVTIPHLKLLSLGQTKVFTKHRLANNSQVVSAFIWRNKITYLDSLGTLWSLNVEDFNWQKLGKLPTKYNLHQQIVKTSDELLEFDILAAYNGHELLTSDDAIEWNSYQLPTHLRNLDNARIYRARKSGVLIVHDRNIWITSDFLTWERKTNLPFNSRYGSLVEYNEEYIQYGGCDTNEFNSCHNRIARSKDLSVWHEFKNSFIKVRKQAAIYSSSQSVYIHGGLQKFVDSKIYHSVNGSNFKTTKSPDTSELRQHFLLKLHNKLFVIGGVTKKNQPYPFMYLEQAKVMQSLSSCGLQLFSTFQTFQT